MYKITEIIGAKSGVYAGKNKIRTSFKVEGDSRTLSAFTDDALAVGQEIEGTIVDKEKDGKIYHNFNFGGGETHKTVQQGYQPTPDLLRVERKVDAILTELNMIRTVMNDIKNSGQPF